MINLLSADVAAAWQPEVHVLDTERLYHPWWCPREDDECQDGLDDGPATTTLNHYYCLLQGRDDDLLVELQRADTITLDGELVTRGEPTVYVAGLPDTLSAEQAGALAAALATAHGIAVAVRDDPEPLTGVVLDRGAGMTGAGCPDRGPAADYETGPTHVNGWLYDSDSDGHGDSARVRGRYVGVPLNPGGHGPFG